MKLGILFSGGKDSTLALHLAKKAGHDIVCLISILSDNEDSYMFHTPNIHLTEKQAEALDIPIITQMTKGEKEIELDDLDSAIKKAIKEYEIEGIVTGAVGSVYQAKRVQKICKDHSLWCFNPLWQMDQVKLLKMLVNLDFEIRIVGVAGYPLSAKWLGRKIDEKSIAELKILQEKYKINPAGEGGEFETISLAGPCFKKKIEILDYEVSFENHAGRLDVREVKFV